MDFTNINDPAGVKALLDQLRASQAWQELNSNTDPALPENTTHPRNAVETTHNAPFFPALETEPEPEPEPESSPFVSNHISSLLSRLQPGGGDAPPPSPSCSIPRLGVTPHDIHREFTFRSSSRPKDPKVSSLTSTPIRPSSLQTKNPRSLNFNQALPVIGRLSEDPTFMGKLEKMQEDQARLERNLWEERTHILKAQEEKVKVAQAKAAIIGAGLNQSDASSLRSSFEKELKAFDCEHVLPAWDSLVIKQQNMLEALGVPGMFVTAVKAEREKQQRIVQVLDGLSGSGDDDI